jgi:hypothetical protein
MSNLQELIYKQLPQSIKKTIVDNEQTYPEYNEVILQLNNEILSGFKTKVKLTKKDITLMSILLSVYYHIKNNPPNKFIIKKNKKDINVKIKAWSDFSTKNYPFYDELEDDIDRWPKFMFLLFYTYINSYTSFYNLKSSPFIIDIPPFNRKTMKFISYIYNIYKYLDANVTLDEFRDWGY